MDELTTATWLRAMSHVDVLVVGDIMLDTYVIGTANRLSPEAPVPIVHVTERRPLLGGAGNVAANVRALGATCTLLGRIGTDPAGEQIQELMRAAGIEDEVQVTGRTMEKQRVLVNSQQVARIDDDILTEWSSVDEAAITGRAERWNQRHTASPKVLLLSDYDKGALTKRVIQDLIAWAAVFGIPVVADPKFTNFWSYTGATVVKPNKQELERVIGRAADADARRFVAEQLKASLVMTCGADGMYVGVTHIPSAAHAVFDVSGAGDTVTAWLGVALAAGASLLEAAHLATRAAGIEVSKLGVAAVHPEEILLTDPSSDDL